MLAKRFIPCLDVKAGRVVKGINFEGLRDAGDPVEIARRYDEQGADELTFLDITASSDERDIILHVVEQAAEMSADRSVVALDGQHVCEFPHGPASACSDDHGRVAARDRPVAEGRESEPPPEEGAGRVGAQ